MKKFVCSIMIIIQLFILTGCFGARTIIDQTLVTSIGVDFKDNQYIVTIQALNFSNIAKQEGPLQEATLPLIAQATAKNLQSAFNKLESMSPIPLYFGHVNSIILSKSVIGKKMKTINSFINGTPLLRYTIWVYGTDQDVKDILSSQSFFNLPFLYTVVYNPSEKSRGSLVPLSLKFNQFISRYHQPVGSILIPTLKIDDKNFEEKMPSKVAYIDGAYVLSQQQLKGHATVEELNSVNWLDQENYDWPLILKKDKLNLDVRTSKGKIKVISGGKTPKYSIKVKTNVAVTYNENGLDQNKIKTKIKERIKEDIMNTVKQGEKLDSDILNLTEKAYRFYRKEWNIKTLNDLKVSSIKDIQVDVHILGSKANKR